jgi:small subunit ribosomal protein S6
MPVNTYEAMFLLDSTKLAGTWEETEQQIHAILTRHGGEILASRQWDDRRLAYPVEGQKKGTYMLTYFRADATKLKEISHDCRLSDTILRELVLKIHPKLVEHLMNQSMNFQPGAEEEERPPGRRDDEDERPRRRRRDSDEG